jgi:hypothetical protein
MGILESLAIVGAVYAVVFLADRASQKLVQG